MRDGTNNKQRAAGAGRLALLSVLAVAVVSTILAFSCWNAFRGHGSAPESNQPRPPQRSPATADSTLGSAEPVRQAVTADGPADALPQPDAPRPATVAALVEELTRVVDHLRKRFPRDPDSLEIMARVQFWLGDCDRAVKLWEKCLELEPRYGHAYFGMGLASAKKGEYEAAAAFFRKSLMLAPASTETRVMLGEALINQGKMEDTIAVLQPGIGSHPPTARGAVLLAEAYLHLRNYEKARENYQAAIEINPYAADTYYGLATTCARLGQKDKAAEWMDRFKQLRAGERKARQDEKKNYDDLDATCQEVAKKYTDVGRVLHAHGDLEAAEKIWRRAATLSPGDVACRQALAWRYRQSGRLPQAIAVLRQLAEIERGSPQYDLEIGRLLAQEGDFQAAEKAFLHVREVAPRHPAGYTALARLYLKTKQNVSQAALLARQAVELEPNAANYALLSDACRSGGDRAGALSAIEQAVKLAPNDPRYRQRHEQIKAEQ